MTSPLSSEKHWFVLGFFVILVGAGFLYFIKTQPQPKLSVKPAEGYGSLLIETDPSGATVLVAGEEYETPILVEGLLGGSHRIKITRDGAAPIEQTATVRAPGTANVFIDLTAQTSPAR
jgi:hypothetical protein